MNNWNFFLKNKLKLGLAIGAALVITLLLSQTVFPSDTPTPDAGFIAKLTSLPARLLSMIRLKKDTKLTPDEIAALPTMAPANTVDPALVEATTNFQPVGEGVSTGVEQNTGNRYVKIEAGTVVEVQEYTLADGRRITVIKPIN